MNKGLYILGQDGRTPIACEDIIEWGTWFQKADRHVAKDTIGDVHVSTVFLGLDHGWGEGKPIMFETMIFGGTGDQYQERYATWEEAQEGHRRAVATVSATA